MRRPNELGPPHVILGEWSLERPAHHPVLKEARLAPEDCLTLEDLGPRKLLIRELLSGLEIETFSHIGSVGLSGLRVSIIPKIGLANVMGMVRYAYAFHPDSLTTSVDYAQADRGLADLLAEALLRQVERLARRGLSSFYRETEELLLSPRGRLCMQSAARRMGRVAITCRYDDYTANSPLNQALAEGLRLAALVVCDRDLAFRLQRARDRYFAEQTGIQLSERSVQNLLNSLDRRTSHYREPLTLVKLVVEGCHLSRHQSEGSATQYSFLLNMNVLFERFLERYFHRTSPFGYSVLTQASQSGHFRYVLNPHRWNTPTLRPDLVFLKRGRVLAVGDAKYKNRTDNPPHPSDLYQLTMYGLSFAREPERKVFLFHPLKAGQTDQPVRIEYGVPGSPRVSICLLGVPVDKILEEGDEAWGAWEWIRGVAALAPDFCLEE